eukprot:sb/3477647/
MESCGDHTSVCVCASISKYGEIKERERKALTQELGYIKFLLMTWTGYERLGRARQMAPYGYERLGRARQMAPYGAIWRARPNLSYYQSRYKCWLYKQMDIFDQNKP